MFSCDYAYSILHFAAFWADECLARNSEQQNTSPNAENLLTTEHAQNEWLRRHTELDRLIQVFDERMVNGEHALRGARAMDLRRQRVLRDECAEKALQAVQTGSSENRCIAAWNSLKYSAAAVRNRFDEIAGILIQAGPAARFAAWNRAQSETEFLLQDLIVNNSRTGGNGRLELFGSMKIVRITSICASQRVLSRGAAASGVAQLHRQFAILPDYGAMDIDDRFQNDPLLQLWLPRICAGDTAWRPKSYEDLGGLPCLLVLVQRGRMGDTFPPSFNCLDMRLSYSSASRGQIHLSTLVQELGRLCRYMPRSSKTTELPYALVSKRLFDKLQLALRNNLTLVTGFLTTPDQRVTRAGRLAELEYPPVRWTPLYVSFRDTSVPPIVKSVDAIPIFAVTADDPLTVGDESDVKQAYR